MISPTLIPVNCFCRPDDGSEAIGATNNAQKANRSEIDKTINALMALHKPEENITEEQFRKAAKIPALVVASGIKV